MCVARVCRGEARVFVGRSEMLRPREKEERGAGTERKKRGT